MTISPDPHVSAMEGITALPRDNGDLVFEAPWEGRAFGLAVAMNDNSFYEWSEFSTRLIDAIVDAEKDGSQSTYYERWLDALESLSLEKGLVVPEELDARTIEFESGQRDDHN